MFVKSNFLVNAFMYHRRLFCKVGCTTIGLTLTEKAEAFFDLLYHFAF